MTIISIFTESKRDKLSGRTIKTAFNFVLMKFQFLKEKLKRY
jgi:hypothetical protein